MLTIAELMARLDELEFQVLLPAATPVHDVAFWDGPDWQPEPHVMVLAAGVDPSSAEALRCLDSAGAAGAAAVMVKLEGEVPAGLLAAASLAGVGLLAARPAVRWQRVHELVRGALQAVHSGLHDVPDGGLFALADAVSAVVGSAILIEDAHGRVLAYSTSTLPTDASWDSTILAGRCPVDIARHLTRSGAYQAFCGSEILVRVAAAPDLGLGPRCGVALCAGGELLGRMWSVGVLSRTGEEALADAARVATSHLLRRPPDEQRMHHATLLAALLDGRTPPEESARELSLDPDGEFHVIAYGIDELLTRDPADQAVCRERILTALADYWSAFRHLAVSAIFEDCIYTLLPAPPGARIRSLTEDAMSHVRARTELSVTAAVSARAALQDLPRARREADQVLRLMDGQQVSDVREMASRVLMLELADAAAARPQWRSEKLARLTAHDAEHGTSYIATLRSYLDAFGDVSFAAQRVSVHPKTMRYRLRRIEELAHIDLGDAEERLATSLQLRFSAAAGR